MITFANAKINIGLQVLNRRADGYHNLETIFYPVGLVDVLEIVEADDLRFIASGIPIPGSDNDNLCLKAYELLAADHQLPFLHIYLHKVVPIGAGLGGGSADAAFLLKLINERFELGLQADELIGYARHLGADCAFFVRNKPCFARGIGDDLTELTLDLSMYRIALVKPEVYISTSMAYRSVVPDNRGRQLSIHIHRPVSEWKECIANDFEVGIFKQYPEIRGVKAALYDAGAIYASMSGSGSTVYGIFQNETKLPDLEMKHQVFYL